MKVVVMGAGGVGGYLGAKLAYGGVDVSFVARGAHLGAMTEQGLTVNGVESIHLDAVRCSDRPADIGPADVILFCVKLYDTESAARLLAPIVGAETLVLTFQNGIDSVSDIGKVLGHEHLLGGAAYFPANITAPGVITYLGKIASKPHIAFAEPGAGPSERVMRLAAHCRAAGIEVEVPDDTERMLWEKFLLIAGTSAATALTRCAMGPVCSDPDMRWLLRETIAETYRVAVASGMALDAGIVDATLATLDGNPPDGKSSQLVDLENGRRLELEGLSGAVVRRGQALGVATPVHRAVYAALKPFVSGATV